MIILWGTTDNNLIINKPLQLEYLKSESVFIKSGFWILIDNGKSIKNSDLIRSFFIPHNQQKYSYFTVVCYLTACGLFINKMLFFIPLL